MDGTALFPYPFSLNQNSEHKVTTRDVEDFAESLQLNDGQLGELSLQVFGSAGSRSQNAQNLLRQFDGGAYIGNKVLLIPQLRSVHGINQYTANADPFLGKDKPYCFSGERLIDLLFELQHPPLEKQSDKRKLQSITNLMRHITDNQTISIEIPHDKSSILIEMDGKILPLHNLGSGIEELLIMGAASISFENRIICIEEPELHIHPILQRKLIEFLRLHTNNMYFITTHSPSLIDLPNSSIFDARLVDGKTVISSVGSDLKVREAFHDLGYRPSDLLQANSIIWVEGPSDRIYLNKWLSIAAPKLEEGVDYTIMFYGGRLLAHLSATGETTGEFINLLKINRFSAVIIDSDRKSKSGEINKTKQRIVDEIDIAGGVSWVTNGREIENEIPKTIFEDACKMVGKLSAADRDDIYADRMIRADDKSREIDKIMLAKAVAELTTEIPVNIVEVVNKIVDFIGTATLKSV